LGTTADLGSADFGWDLTAGFGATAAGQWLAANAVTYGFVMSYPDGKEAITGYEYEPWHFRYIGAEQAQAWQASGLTLNQFLGA
jgi:D-alanyl-D-alanine carboxypeptidase